MANPISWIKGKLEDFNDWRKNSVGGNLFWTFVVPFGFIATGKDIYEAQKEAQEAQEEAERQSRITSALNGDISSLPYIKGAKNTAATGKTQPFIIGRHLFTPYILNGGGGTYKGYHKIGGAYGSDEFYYVVLENGFNRQIIEKINVGDVTVADIEQESPQDGIFYFNKGSDFAGDGSFIEIAQDGNGFATSEFNQKVVEQDVSAQLKFADDDDYEPLLYTLDKNAMAADVIIMFNGLYEVDSDGNKVNHTSSVKPEWSSDYAEILAEGGDVSNATWHEFTFEQKYEKTTTVYKTSYYTVGSVSYKYGYQTQCESYQRKSALKNAGAYDKSKWTYKSGDGDIKDDDGATSAVYLANVTRTTKDAGHDGNHSITYVKADVMIKVTKAVTTTTTETTSSNSFTFNKQSQLRFNAHADLPFSAVFDTDSDGNTTKRENPVTVRISTTDNKNDKARCDVYVQYVQSECCNASASISAGSFVAEKVIAEREAKLSTLVGIKIKATSANSDKLDKISVVTNGLARTWDGSEWSTDKERTSNIAAWTLEILTSPTHLPSKAEDTELDLATFGDWYEYCEENGLYVNKVLTSGASKETILASLAQAGRAVLYQDTNGKISVAYDRIQETPEMLLNPENMTSFSWKKDLSRQSDGVRLTFVEGANDAFDTNTITRMYEQYNSAGEDQWADSEARDTDAEITEIEGYGITDDTQAAAYMDYTMRCARLRLKDASCQIGKEGVKLRPYDRVQVQHWAIGRGEGSTRVKAVVKNAAGKVTGVTTYEPVMMSAGEKFYAEIQCTGSGSAEIAVICSGIDETRGSEISFDIAQDINVKSGDIISYGLSADTISEDFIVRSVTPSGDGYELSLTEYDEDIFAIGDIPEYVSPLSLSGDVRKINIPSESQLALLEKIYDTKYDTLHSGATPDTPTASAKVGKDGITFTCAAGGTSLYNTVKSFTAVLYKGADDTEGTEITSDDGNFTYDFDRSTDGYPEADELSEWTFKAKATSVYGMDSEWTDTAHIDTSSYGTWKFSFTSSSVTSDVNCRTVILSFAPEKMAGDTKDLYGEIRYRVSISRAGFVIDGDTGEETSESIADTDSDGNAVYYAPNLSASPYPSGTAAGGDYSGNEDAYKDTSNSDGYITSGSRFSQTLPLYGQEKYTESDGEWTETGKKIQNTTYLYKVTAVNETGEEHTVSGYAATALCTAIQDLVYSHSYYKNLYVEKLSAINANIGLISQGGFGDFSGWNNFWALSYLTAEASGVAGGVKAGAFKVGDTNQYIMVIPPGMTFGSGDEAVENDSDTDFMIRIKAGNITLSSTGAEFESGTYVYDDTDTSKRMHLTAGGIEIEREEDGEWSVKARVTCDSSGNMFVTNAPAGTEGLPEFATAVSSPTSIYHLEGDVLDTDGGNAGNFTFSAESWPSSTLVNGCSKLMKGTAEKSLEAEDVCLFTDTDIYIDGRTIDIEAGTVSGSSASAWNTKLGVSCFS